MVETQSFGASRRCMHRPVTVRAWERRIRLTTAAAMPYRDAVAAGRACWRTFWA